jgi:hypothetical protein
MLLLLLPRLLLPVLVLIHPAAGTGLLPWRPFPLLPLLLLLLLLIWEPDALLHTHSG